MLRLQSNECNYHLIYNPGTGNTLVDFELLANLENFDTMVFGHFHKPRKGPPAYDDGCMLKNTRNTIIQTYMVIESDGRIIPSW